MSSSCAALTTREGGVKILHVELSVRVGDVVEPGQGLGTLLRSGFFDFWTDPHIHIEVRKPSDALRARGGFRFQRLMKPDVSEAVKELTGTVVDVTSEYSLVALDGRSRHGVPVRSIDGPKVNISLERLKKEGKN